MNSTSSLLSRFKADTPIIFKIFQLIGVLMLIAALAVPGIPKVSTAFTYVGGTLAILCFFIVKDIDTLAEGGLNAATLLKLVTDIPSQISGLKDFFTKPTADISQLLTLLTQIGASAAPVDPGPALPDGQPQQQPATPVQSVQPVVQQPVPSNPLLDQAAQQLKTLQ